MIATKQQYQIDQKGRKKSIVISIEDWNKILDELEELDDIRTYDKAKKKKEELIPLRKAIHERRRKNG